MEEDNKKPTLDLTKMGWFRSVWYSALVKLGLKEPLRIEWRSTIGWKNYKGIRLEEGSYRVEVDPNWKPSTDEPSNYKFPEGD